MAQPASGPNQYSAGPLLRFGPTDLTKDHILQPGLMISGAYNNGPDTAGKSTSYGSGGVALSLSHGDKKQRGQFDSTLSVNYSQFGNFGPQSGSGGQDTAANVVTAGGSAQGTLFLDALHNHPLTLEAGDFLLGGARAGSYQLGNRVLVGGSVAHYFGAGGNTRAGLILSGDFVHENYSQGGVSNAGSVNLTFVFTPR